MWPQEEGGSHIAHNSAHELPLGEQPGFIPKPENSLLIWTIFKKPYQSVEQNCVRHYTEGSGHIALNSVCQILFFSVHPSWLIRSDFSPNLRRALFVAQFLQNLNRVWCRIVCGIIQNLAREMLFSGEHPIWPSCLDWISSRISEELTYQKNFYKTLSECSAELCAALYRRWWSHCP